MVYVVWRLAAKEVPLTELQEEEGQETEEGLEAEAGLEDLVEGPQLEAHLEHPEETPRFSSQILVARARVAPLAGTTIPKAELQALLILLRLQVEILHSTSLKPERVVSTSDSKCFLAALNKQGAQLKAFFSNRVAEAHQLLQEGREQCPGMDQVTWIEGSLNPEDIGTRPGSNMSDLGPESRWQQGPAFHHLPREKWPQEVVTDREVPQTEVRTAVPKADPTQREDPHDSQKHHCRSKLTAQG